MDFDQERMWESVQTLSMINKDQAKAVYKVTIEKSLDHMGIATPVLTGIDLGLPQSHDLHQLQTIDRRIREAIEGQEKERAYELLVDFIDILSATEKENSKAIRKKILSSIFMQHSRKASKIKDKTPVSMIALSGKRDEPYYSPMEVAQKLGLSDQTIRRMCEKGKFPGAFKTDGGHWRIPEDLFITTREQDSKAEIVLERIDPKKCEYGDTDEYHL